MRRAHARDPAARGQVLVRFVIGGDGAVRAAGVVEAPAPLQTAAACIAQATHACYLPQFLRTNAEFSNLRPPARARYEWRITLQDTRSPGRRFVVPFIVE